MKKIQFLFHFHQIYVFLIDSNCCASNSIGQTANDGINLYFESNIPVPLMILNVHSWVVNLLLVVVDYLRVAEIK
jgi:hypothetical protein